MKVLLIGEAADHRETLLSSFSKPVEVVNLPASAAYDASHDSVIAPEDVVVALNFRREGQVPKFALLHVPGAGLDGIDLASLPLGCALCNVYEHQIPIAEYVLLAMLECSIRMAEMRARFSELGWAAAYRLRMPHGELFGRSVCLVGFGGIGRAVAARARAFGMRVLAADIAPRGDEGLAERVVGIERLDDILPESDFVVITCPLTDDTEGLFDAPRIARMKESAYLINISRGRIVNERDIYEALSERRIAGAVIDVWWNYPASAADEASPSKYPFGELENVIATPHSCAWTKELFDRRYAVIAKNVESLRDGGELINRVR